MSNNRPEGGRNSKTSNNRKREIKNKVAQEWSIKHIPQKANNLKWIELEIDAIEDDSDDDLDNDYLQ